MSRRRGYKQLVEADLDIMPLMNLFVVLIPMLLLSAVFVEMSAIDMSLPSADAQDHSEADKGLDLAIRLESERYVVVGRSLRKQVIDRNDPEADTKLADILAAIHEAHPDEVAIRIESPDAARYQDLVTVMDISRDAGLSAIALASHPESSNLRSAR